MARWASPGSEVPEDKLGKNPHKLMVEQKRQNLHRGFPDCKILLCCCPDLDIMSITLPPANTAELRRPLKPSRLSSAERVRLGCAPAAPPPRPRLAPAAPPPRLRGLFPHGGVKAIENIPELKTPPTSRGSEGASPRFQRRGRCRLLNRVTFIVATAPWQRSGL